MTRTISPVRRRVGAAVALAALALPAATGCALQGDLVAYDLPPDDDRYTLEVVTDGVTTVWEYRSAYPEQGDHPEVQVCPAAALGSPNAEPCRPEPLIFLRYDWHLAMDDTARAGARHTVEVSWYYQERLTRTPEVTSLTAEASFDGGDTWQPARVRVDRAPQTFSVTIDHPRSGAEAVTLRISAVDSEGNTVVQTLPEAYRLA